MGDEFLPAPFKGLFSRCDDAPTEGEQAQEHDGLWYVERNEGESATIQPLSPQFVPTGKRELIDSDDLLNNYCPEPALYQKKVRPQVERMEKALERGDKLREEGQFQRAESQYGTALSLDENNVRACFGIGICYVRKNDRDKAVFTLEKLLTLEAAFDARYKALYNEFGIALRKMKMFDEALRFYAKGAEAAADDDHLMFNISRAHWENDEFKESLSYLDKALAINPGLNPARLMKKHLLKIHPELTSEAAPTPPKPKDHVQLPAKGEAAPAASPDAVQDAVVAEPVQLDSGDSPPADAAPNDVQDDAPKEAPDAETAQEPDDAEDMEFVQLDSSDAAGDDDTST